jgi:two-component system chemotaxis response regulator CheV
LLEAGTNEVEVLVFLVGEEHFGVNVAKVREVLPVGDVTAIAGGHDAVDGVVRVRDFVVTVANLERYLYNRETTVEGCTEGRLLLLEFNNEMIAFRVHDVERIYRLSWKDVIPTPDIAATTAPVTSVICLEDRLIPMLDFEAIGAKLGMAAAHAAPKRSDGEANPQADLPIVFVDDSPLVREMLLDELTSTGFNNVQGFNDGQFAWEYLSAVADGSTPEELVEKIAAVVTDVEMPRMDGLSLTRRIKTHPKLKNVPVILFSSIASNVNKNKGHQVGAAAQIAKPNYAELATALSEALEQPATARPAELQSV